MKQLLFLAFLCLSIQSHAQQVFESNYVYKGQTFQFTLPEGYSEARRESTYLMPELVGFVPDGQITEDFDELSKLEQIILVMLVEKDDQTLEEIRTMMEKDADGENIVIYDQFSIKPFNGRDFLRGGAILNLGDDDSDINRHSEIAVTEFGDYFVMINFMDAFEKNSAKNKSDIDKMIASFKVIDTNKEELTFEEEDEWEELLRELESMEDTEEVSSDFYENSEFESQFSYEDIFFDMEDDDEWEEDLDNTPKALLISFKCSLSANSEVDGYIKAFSGGKVSDYSSPQDLISALKKVFPDEHVSKLIKKSERIEGEEHTFSVYDIDGLTTLARLYTTVEEGELLFIIAESVVYDSREEFLKQSDEFTKSMWMWNAEMMEDIEAPAHEVITNEK